MLRKADNQEHDTDDIDDWEKYKTNEYKHKYACNTRVEDKADIEIYNLITSIFFFRSELIFAYQ